MAHQTFDRIQEYSSSTGTGVFALSGAVVGYRTFGSKLSIGDTCHYLIEAVDAQGVPTGDWETGRGTYTAANQLTRTTVIDSSNAGATVNFVAGTKRTALVILTPITDQARADWQEMLRNDSTPVGSLSYASTSVAPPGWLSMVGGTFGSGASGATVALDATFALFSLWWAGYSDAALPIYTNAGAGSTRGASAQADWNAGKRLTMFDEQGRFRRGIGGAAAAIGVAQASTAVFLDGSNDTVIRVPRNSGGVQNGDGNPGLNAEGNYLTGATNYGPTLGVFQKVRPDNRAWWPIVKYGYTPNTAADIVRQAVVVRVTNSGVQSVASSTITKVTGWNTVDYDSAGWSVANSDFRPTRPGKYRFTMAASMAVGGITSYLIMLYKNGAEVSRGWQIALTGGASMNTAIAELNDIAVSNGSDVFDMRVYQISGGAGTVGALTRFTAEWIGN